MFEEFSLKHLWGDKPPPFQKMTLQESRQQLQQARSQIQQQRSLAEQQERELTQSRESISEQQKRLSAQRVLRQLNRTGQVKRGVQLKKLGEAGTQVQSGLSQVQQFKGQLSQAEQEVAKGEKQVQAYETLQTQIQRSTRDKPGWIVGSRLRTIKEAFKQAGLDPEEGAKIYIEQVQGVSRGIESQAKYDALKSAQKELGMSLTPEARKKITDSVRIGDGSFSYSLDYKGDSSVKQNILVPEIKDSQVLMSVQPERKTIIDKGIDFVKSDLRIPVFIGAGGTVSSSQVKEVAESYGTGGKTLSLFIPQTKGDLAVMSVVGALAGGSGVIGATTRTIIGGTGLYSVINPESTPEQKLAGGIMAFGVGIKPSVKIPKEISYFTRDVKPTSFVEVQRPASIFGKETNLVSYTIQREITPPKITIKDTGEGFLFSKPKYTPAKVEIIKSPVQLADAPILTYSRIGQGKTGEINILTGSSIERVPTSRAEFNSLSRQEQFLWKRFAEKITGNPVTMERVPLILSKNAQSARGYINQMNIGRYSTNKGKVTFNLFEKGIKGKSTTQTKTVSQFEKVAETEQVQIFKGDIIFKDTSKPFSRASGQTPSMTGTIFQIKEPLIIGEPSSSSSIIKFTGSKTKPSESLFQNLGIAEVIKPIPKTSKITTSKIKTIQTTEPAQKTFITFPQEQQVRQEQNLIVNEKTKQDTKIIQGVLPKQEIKTFMEQTPKVESIFKTDTKQTQDVLQKTGTSTKQVSKVESIFKQTPRQTTKPRQTPLRPEPKKPTPIKPILTKPSLVQRLTKKVQEEGNIFSVVGRRFGEDIEIFKTRDKKQAEKKAVSFLKTTLGRSAKVFKDGEEIAFKDLSLSKNLEFRPAKKDSSRIVQRRKYGLGTGQERSEIQSFRRKAKKKQKKFNWF